MKICLQCDAAFTEDYVFCLTCGNKLVDEGHEQVTVASTRVGLNPFPESGIAEFCPNCGHGNKEGSRFCKKCGGTMLEESGNNAPPQPFGGFAPNFGQQPPPRNLNETVAFQPPISHTPTRGNVTNRSNQNIIIGALVAGVILLLGLAYLIVSSGTTGTTAKNANSSASNSDSSPSDSKLPDSFERTYSGTIGTRSTMSLTMSLKKNGAVLSGRAETPDNWDALQGTIEPDGDFQLNGNERGGQLTGTYTGVINSDGTISGTWTKLSGRGRSEFSLTQDN